MKAKKLLSAILSVAMLFTIVAQPVLAADIHTQSGKIDSIVSPVEYPKVAAKIAVAQEETVIHQETGDIHYYWSTNSFVVKDNSGYYFVEISEDFTAFIVNGKTFDITANGTSAGVSAVTYPTAWVTVFDTNNTFDVGGLPHSVVGGIIGSAAGAMIPSAGISSAVGIVVGALAGLFIGGVFPIDYKITVMVLVRSRILEPNVPTVMEYYERLGIYGGPASNLYDTQLYYNARTYTQEYWE